MTALATLAATQQLACRICEAMLRQQRAKMLMAAPPRVVPVHASCGEKHRTLDQSFVDYAAKEPEEPIVLDAAAHIIDRFRLFCSQKTEVTKHIDLGHT